MATEKDKIATTGTWLDLGLEILQALATSAEEAAKKAEEDATKAGRSSGIKPSPTEEARKNARTALTDDYLQIKELRRSIDACIQKAQERRNALVFGRGLNELNTAITKLKEAKMWCGQALGELGHKLPPAYRDEAD